MAAAMAVEAPPGVTLAHRAEIRRIDTRHEPCVNARRAISAMVSTVHEALRDLLRENPWVCVELLAMLAWIDRASIDEAACVDPTVPQNVPPALSADVAVVLRARATPTLVVAVEVQLEREDDKRWTWPVYLSALRREHRCPAALLVIAPSPLVASWAREAIALGPGASMSPWVLGPTEIPVVTDRREAMERPALAVLSAIAHGSDGARGLDVVFTAMSAVDTLDEPRSTVYTAAIWDALDRAAQRALEVLMSTDQPRIETNFERRIRELFEDKWRRNLEERLRGDLEAKVRSDVEAKLRSDLEERLRGDLEAKVRSDVEAKLRSDLEERLRGDLEAKLRSDVEAKLRSDLEERLRSEFETKVRAEGEAAALRTVLEARGFVLDATIDERIRRCSDLATLQRWIARAVHATSLDAVFDEPR
jgi:hypothetical protein